MIEASPFSRALRNTEKWFGVGDDSESQQQVWHRRSLRHCSQRFGKLKVQYREPDTASSFEQTLDSPATHKMPKVPTGFRTSACSTLEGAGW